MSNGHSNNSEKKAKTLESVEGLFKTVMESSAIMLALLWGLTQHSFNEPVLATIRISSIILVVSIFFSLLGLQFIVSKLEQDIKNITKETSVTTCYLIAWVSFIAGCIAVIIAIFQL